MSNKHYLGVVLVSMALCLPLSAKINQDFSDQSLTGRYTSGADSIALSVNDLGKVEGIYTRNGVFGEVSGEIVDGLVVGAWRDSDPSSTCSTEQGGYSSWGQVQISLDSEGVLKIERGLCGQTDASPASWILRRSE